MPPPSSTSSNAERAALVLIELGRAGEEGTSLGDLAGGLGEAKPAVHRTLTALSRHGFVETIARGRYRLGPAIHALARQPSAAAATVRRWRPVLMQTAARFGHTVYLVGRAGANAIVLDMEVGSAPVQALTDGIGGRLPLGLGPGPAAILSTFDPALRDVVLASNEAAYRRHGADPATIRAFVEDAVTVGHARDLGLFIASCGGVALPVREENAEASAAITVAAPLAFFTPDRIDDVVQTLGRDIEAQRIRPQPWLGP